MRTRQGETICLGFWIRPASANFPPAGRVWGGMLAGFGLGGFGNSAAYHFLNQKEIVPLTLHRQYHSDDLLHLQSNGVSRPTEIQLYYSERRLSLSNDLVSHQISKFFRQQYNLFQSQINHHSKFHDHDFVLS